MDNTPFYQSLPKWACNSIKNRKCSQCNKHYTKDNIVAVGVRKLKDRANAMYIEHKCSYCGFRALTALGKQKEDTLEKLCYVILESIKKRKITEKSTLLNKQSNKPMTDKEITNFLKFVRTHEMHDDFLREIGVAPQHDDPS